MSERPTPETYNLAPWPNETGYDATPTLRCGWCNGVGNMKPLPREYEEGSLEPGFLPPAVICPRCNGSGLDPDCTKEEIGKGVRLSERERDEARKELNEIKAERDLARLSSMESDQTHDHMVGELENVYKKLDEAKEKIKHQAERIRKLEGATNHATGTPLSVAISERNDALNQIQGWENKWKAAIEMAAIAEIKCSDLKEEVANLQDQCDLAMKVIKRLEANQP